MKIGGGCGSDWFVIYLKDEKWFDNIKLIFNIL